MRCDSEAQSRDSAGLTLFAMRGLELQRSMIGDDYEISRCSGAGTMDEGSRAMKSEYFGPSFRKRPA